jgi:hypothetical protein
MRRPTLITLVVLLVLLIVVAVIQLNQPRPSAPFPGPASGTLLPSGLTTVPPSSPGA